MRYVLLALITIGMMTYAVIDCVRTEDSRIRLGLPHWFWVAIIILLPFAGALLWLIVAAVNRRRFEDGPAARPSRPRGPVAPDDDPDFLFRLERDRRRAQQAREGRDRGTSTGHTGQPGTGPSTGQRPTGPGTGQAPGSAPGSDAGGAATPPGGSADSPGPHREESGDEELLYIPEEFQDLPLPQDGSVPEQQDSPADPPQEGAGEDDLADRPNAEDHADEDNNGRS